MTELSQQSVRNRLLRVLPAESFERLRPHLEHVEIPLRTVLVVARKVTEYACFIERGLGSVVATNADAEEGEVGHIGWDGMTGSHVVLGADRTPKRTFMQVAGTGFRIRVPALHAVMEADPALRRLLLLQAHCAELQLAHTALANARYDMNARLARWLLMSHDRLQDDNMRLTHAFLSLMLGVRRSGVTNALHILEGANAITSTRANVFVKSRLLLEEAAGACYGEPEQEYERLLGISPRRESQYVAA
jgi:CRP-like cAMP-binding protein